MTSIVLLVSAGGETGTFASAATQPVRIDLPEGAVLGARDAMSGKWRPFFPDQRKRHHFSDFSILDV